MFYGKHIITPHMSHILNYRFKSEKVTSQNISSKSLITPYKKIREYRSKTFCRGPVASISEIESRTIIKFPTELAQVTIHTHCKIDTEKTIYLNPYKSRLFFVSFDSCQ